MRQRNRRIHFQTFHIDIFSELEEYPGGFAEVSESDVEKFIEGEDDHILPFRKLIKKSCLLCGNFIRIYIINRTLHGAWGYEFYLRVLKVSLTSEKTVNLILVLSYVL